MGMALAHGAANVPFWGVLRRGMGRTSSWSLQSDVVRRIYPNRSLADPTDVNGRAPRT